jgi:biopolymer transport protein TolQ
MLSEEVRLPDITHVALWIVQGGIEQADGVVQVREQMPEPAGGMDILALLAQTGVFARAILVILLLFSVASWAVILSKGLLLRKIRKESATFWRIFRKAHTLSEVRTAVETLNFTPLVPVFDAAWDAARAGRDAPEGGSPARVERTLRRVSAAELSKLESRLTFLATTASVTPYIGLLGTVGGVIGSFAGLANTSVATLAAVAPGIADALIATGCGLFAAIPAVIAYNHFVAQIRHLGTEIDDLGAEMLIFSEGGESRA